MEASELIVPSSFDDFETSIELYRFDVRNAGTGEPLFRPIALISLTNLQRYAQHCNNKKISLIEHKNIANDNTIPFISCDKDAKDMRDVIDQLHNHDVRCAVFYSRTERGCELDSSAEWIKKSVPNVFTTLSVGDAVQIVKQADSQNLVGSIRKTSSLSALEIFSIVVISVVIFLGVILASLRTSRRSARVTKHTLSHIPLLRVVLTQENERDLSERFLDKQIDAASIEKPQGTLSSKIDTSSDDAQIDDKAANAAEQPPQPLQGHLSGMRNVRSNLLASKHQKVEIYKIGKEEFCPICLEEFRKDELLRKLPCSHHFHALCVDPWFLKSSPKCPLCRGNILTTRKMNFPVTLVHVRNHLRRISETLRHERNENYEALPPNAATRDHHITANLLPLPLLRRSYSSPIRSARRD